MLVSISIAARELSLSVEHLRKMIKAKRIPAYKLGPRATRVDLQEIRNLGKLIAEGKLKSPRGVREVSEQGGR